MIKECYLQARLAHKLNKDKRYAFPNFLSALDYVRTNWAGLRENISIGMLWKPRTMRKFKFHRIIRRRNSV